MMPWMHRTLKPTLGCLLLRTLEWLPSGLPPFQPCCTHWALELNLWLQKQWFLCKHGEWKNEYRLRWLNSEGDLLLDASKLCSLREKYKSSPLATTDLCIRISCVMGVISGQLGTEKEDILDSKSLVWVLAPNRLTVWLWAVSPWTGY